MCSGGYCFLLISSISQPKSTLNQTLFLAPTDTSTPVEKLTQVDYKYAGHSYRSSAPSYVDRVLISSNENEQFL